MYISGILPYDIGIVNYNWKFVIHLRENVDSAILDDAVQEASTRYPYSLKRLAKEEESYVISVTGPINKRIPPLEMPE